MLSIQVQRIAALRYHVLPVVLPRLAYVMLCKVDL